ncbi:MAG: AAA family ATPase [Polyangiaceae bacterium]|jgi:hypothetical protein|nr:AAA family ATPase [Polyangiaceae bacterium]
MPYVTRVLAERCRNVAGLDIDLTPASGDSRRFLHLILTGPNGSGKSGILEATQREMEASQYGANDPRVALPQRIAHWEASDLSRSDIQKAVLDDRARLLALQKERPVQLFWDEHPPVGLPGDWFHTAFWATRRLELARVEGPKVLELERFRRKNLSSFLLQYLVNQKTAQAFAGVDKDVAEVARIERWLDRFRQWVGFVAGDPGLQMEFDRAAFNFVFTLSDGYPFDLKQLSDGASSVLAILADLMLREEDLKRTSKDPSKELSGVVLIDEIEAHLHLKLQESILPFLTGLFPGVQFLIATHSPAVIASISGAMVCDLGARTQRRSDDFIGKNYGVLMTGHFGVSSDMDLDTTHKLSRYRELSALTSRTAEQEQELVALRDILTGRSESLAVELWLADGGEGQDDDSN